MTQLLMFPEASARDAAIEQVAANAGETFASKVRDVLFALHGSEVTGEDVRQQCEQQDVRPHHHNAWGAMIAGLVRDGLLVATGEYRPMRAKGSHARKTAVYRVEIEELS
jgi:hypothetical protein